MTTKNSTPVLIFGSGHLAYRIKRLVEEKGHRVIHVSNKVLDTKEGDMSPVDKSTVLLKSVGDTSLAHAYLVDDHDDNNLEMLVILMASQKDLPITASLFNENVAPHLKAAYSTVEILNPAKIAAPAFIEALDKPIVRKLDYAIGRVSLPLINRRSDRLVWTLISIFALVLVSAGVCFHLVSNITWLSSFYLVIATAVGYGDLNLINASALNKVIGISLILSSTIFIWLIFSFSIDRMIKRRVQRSLGRRRYSYKNHVILCGLGRLGFFIAEGLLARGDDFIIIESSENSSRADYFRSRGVDVYIGDARSVQVLQDVCVEKARAVISVISDDYINLEIGLNARSFQPGLRLILRFFDESMARKIRDSLDIQLTLSMSAIADEKFVSSLRPS